MRKSSGCWDDFLANWEKWKERFGYIELLDKRFAVYSSQRNCSGTISVTAHKLRAGLVRKAPVAMRNKEGWTGLSSFK